MHDSTMERCRQKLERMEQEWRERSARTARHLYQRTEPYSADSAEQAVEREDDDVVQYLDHEAHEKLAKIKDALKRIDNNQYGICSECSEEVNEERLLLIPYTSLCVACAAGEGKGDTRVDNG